jgi:hypothetical protein
MSIHRLRRFCRAAVRIEWPYIDFAGFAAVGSSSDSHTFTSQVLQGSAPLRIPIHSLRRCRPGRLVLGFAYIDFAAA